MVQNLQSIDLDKVRFYMSTWSVVGVISLVIWAINISSEISARKTEMEIIAKQEKVSPTDFAVLKNDVAYIKESVKVLLEKK